MKETERTERKRELLLCYLNDYLSIQGLMMVHVIYRIKVKILRREQMTTKQFKSIIKFIEREKEFQYLSREQITTFFDPFIYDPYKEQPYVTNDLTRFFEPQTDQLQCTHLPH